MIFFWNNTLKLVKTANVYISKNENSLKIREKFYIFANICIFFISKMNNFDMWTILLIFCARFFIGVIIKIQVV